MKSSPERTVSHSLGPEDSKMANICILSACLGVPTGPSNLCSTVLSENGGTTGNPIKVT